MYKIAIKNEGTSKWCEVCHQSDKFDPNNDYCLRCSPIKEAEIARFRDQHLKESRFITQFNWYDRLASGYLISSVVPSLLYFFINFQMLTFCCFFFFFIGIALVFIGLHSLVKGSITVVSMWKVISATLFTCLPFIY